jgi:hypothetical protein
MRKSSDRGGISIRGWLHQTAIPFNKVNTGIGFAREMGGGRWCLGGNERWRVNPEG